MVLEQGASGRSSTIPVTLNELLLARLDALPPRWKALAQLCAVLGRDIDVALLSRISARDEASLRRDVEGLVSAGVLRPREDGGGWYQFRHALLQEVAYQSLPRGLRRQHHRRVTQALLEHFPQCVETRPEVLAHHRTEAGDTALAVQSWKRAVELAILRTALQEALSHSRQALRLLRQLPDTPEHRIEELELLNGLGLLLISTQGLGLPELEDTYTRALELYRRIERASPRIIHLWAWLGEVLLSEGKFQMVRELVGQFLALGERLQDPALLAMVHRMEGFSILLQGGRLDRAEASYERMRQLVDPLGRPRRSRLDPMGLDARVDARLLLSGAQSLRGLWREARRNEREALDMMKAGASPLSQVFVLVQLAATHQASMEVHRVLEFLEESSALSQTMSHRPTQTLTSVLEAWALVRSGRKQVDLELLRRGLAQMRATRSWVFVYVLGLLADIYLVLGQVREGLETVEEALRLVEASGGYFMEAELHRLRGELLRRAGQEDEALRCFLRARVRAHRQLAVLLELRATVNLGRQLRDLGCPERARKRMERVSSRMEPDSDSVDLQQARELLDSLPPGDSGA